MKCIIEAIMNILVFNVIKLFIPFNLGSDIALLACRRLGTRRTLGCSRPD